MTRLVRGRWTQWLAWLAVRMAAVVVSLLLLQAAVHAAARQADPFRRLVSEVRG